MDTLTTEPLFHGQAITSVAYGTNENGFPVVIVTTAAGFEAVLTADGYTVYPEFKVQITSKP